MFIRESPSLEQDAGSSPRARACVGSIGFAVGATFESRGVGKLEPFVCSHRSILTSSISKLFYYFNFLLVARWSGFGQELQNSPTGLPSLLKTELGFRYVWSYWWHSLHPWSTVCAHLPAWSRARPWCQSYQEDIPRGKTKPGNYMSLLKFVTWQSNCCMILPCHAFFLYVFHL